MGCICPCWCADYGSDDHSYVMSSARTFILSHVFRSSPSRLPSATTINLNLVCRLLTDIDFDSTHFKYALTCFRGICNDHLDLSANVPSNLCRPGSVPASGSARNVVLPLVGAELGLR